MTANRVHLRIVTPEKVKFDEKADMIIMRCTTGDMGILPDRAACVALLDYGILRIFSEGVEHWIAVLGGFAEMRNNELTILTNAAEWPEDIDVERAKAAQERAEQRMKERTSDINLQNDQIALRRALVRIEVSSYPIISGKSGQ